MFVGVEDGVGVFGFGGDVVGFVAGGDGEPGLPLVKPAFGVVFHCMGVRSPSRPFSLGHPVRPIGSLTSSLRVGGVVFHPDLFAVIHDWRAAQGEIKPGHQFRDLVVVLCRRRNGRRSGRCRDC